MPYAINPFTGQFDFYKTGIANPLPNDTKFYFGTSSDSSIAFNTTQTPDSWVFGVGSTSRSLLIVEDADTGFDFAHAQTVDPTLFIHSHNQSTSQYISFSHDGTNGYIQTGTGNLILASNGGAVYINSSAGTSLSRNGGTGVFSINSGGFSTAIETANVFRDTPVTSHGFITVTGTLAAGGGVFRPGVDFNITSAGTGGANTAQTGMSSILGAGFTGTGASYAILAENVAAGTGTSVFGALGGNYGVAIQAIVTTIGTNVASYGTAQGGNVNYGSFYEAVGTKNSATNIGVAGFGLNAGSSPIQIGGYFGLQSSVPTYASAALMCDNGAVAADIFVARDNGTTFVSIADGGKLIIGPTSGGTTEGGLFWGTVQTPDTNLLMTGSTSNHWVFCESADSTFDFAHAQTTDPTLFIHSHNQATGQWLSLYHNGTDGKIDTGAGGLILTANTARLDIVSSTIRLNSNTLCFYTGVGDNNMSIGAANTPQNGGTSSYNLYVNLKKGIPGNNTAAFLIGDSFVVVPGAGGFGASGTVNGGAAGNVDLTLQSGGAGINGGTNGTNSSLRLLGAASAVVLSAGYTGSIDTYKTVATAGWGVPAIYGSGRLTGQTAQSAALATYTVGAADGSFQVSGNVNVTASASFSFSLNVAYTDETNTAQTLILPMAQLAGAFVTGGLITNLTGAGPYESPVIHIRCKASTSITIRPSAGTFTSVTYNAEGFIAQIA